MRDEIIVAKMLTYVKKILGYVEGMSYETFVYNELVIEACVFNLSQLGEIANKMDVAYQNAHKEIQWRQIYGLRNRIVHDYEGVNRKLVWEIISDDLPKLKRVLEHLTQEVL